MDNNEKQIKYVDLVGLEHFATRLKSYLKNHVMEYGIFQELLNEIQNRTFYKVVTSYEELLNESPKKNIIYLVPDNLGNFLEYVWIEDRKEYEQLGSFTPELKLDDYLKKEDSPFEKGSVDGSAIMKGGDNKATYSTSFAHGYGCKALSSQAHAEGFKTEAKGANSHSEGYKTITLNESEHAQGRLNKSNTGDKPSEKTLYSLGIGTLEQDRKNAHEIMQDGKHYIHGIGGYDGTNPITAKSVQEVINELINKLNEITTND